MKSIHAFVLSLIVGASGTAMLSGASAKPCCPAPEATAPVVEAKAPEPVGTKSTCCEEVEADAFSSSSLYQLEGRFVDDSGRAVKLGELRGRPVVLAMFFSSCTYACPMLVADMAKVRSELPEDKRDDVALVLVSFDTARDTVAALKAFRDGRSLDAQWHLYRGEQDAISELAALVGVKYKLESDGQFAHSNLLTVLNAEGEVVHQRLGLKGGLEEVVRAIAKL